MQKNGTGPYRILSAKVTRHLERKQGSTYVLRLSPGLDEDKGLKPLPTNKDGSME